MLSMYTDLSFSIIVLHLMAYCCAFVITVAKLKAALTSLTMCTTAIAAKVCYLSYVVTQVQVKNIS